MTTSPLLHTVGFIMSDINRIYRLLFTGFQSFCRKGESPVVNDGKSTERNLMALHTRILGLRGTLLPSNHAGSPCGDQQIL